MESLNYHEESRRNYSSSEELMVDNDDDYDEAKKEVDLGVGRSYECVFCKRGFNTAQALGGHMNIHRKDRSRNRPPSNSTNHHLHQTPPTSIFMPSSNIPHFTSYFPAAASSNSTLYQSSNYHHHRDCPQPSNIPLIPADWRMGMRLSLEIQDLGKNTLQPINQDKELDLELRLGYD